MLASVLLAVSMFAPVVQATVLNSWQGATPMEEFVPDTVSASPVLATNEYGYAVAAWLWYYDSTYYVRASYYDPSTGWSSPLVLDPRGGADTPSVAIDRYGTALVAWTVAGTSVSVAGCAYKAGYGWGVTSTLNPNGAAGIAGLSVINERPGKFMAIYLEEGATANTVMSVNYSALMGFDEPSILAQVSNDFQALTASTDGAGHTWIAWREFGSGELTVSVLHATNGTWDASPYIVPTPASFSPVVASGPNGTALIAYGRYFQSQTLVLVSEYNGSEWSQPLELLNTTGSLTELVMSIDDHGNAVLGVLVTEVMTWSVYGYDYNGTTWSVASHIIESPEYLYSLVVDHDSDGSAKLAYVRMGDGANPLWHILVHTFTPETGWGYAEERGMMGGSSIFSSIDLVSSGVNYWLIFSRFEFEQLTEARIWIDQFRGIASGSALLTIDESLINATVNVPSVELRGTAEPGSSIMINGLAVYVGEDGNFTVSMPLEEGKNTFTITTTDSMGRYASEQITVTYSFGPAETAGLLAVFLGALAIMVSLVIMVLFLQYKRMKN